MFGGASHPSATPPLIEAAPPATVGDPDDDALRRRWPILLVGCLAAAAVSLIVLPHGVAYDPYSWLIWGREITHLDLDTRTAATAVKPLPIFVTTLLSPAGSLAPALWLLIARTAALLSLVLAFRVACRLGGPIAGLVAAVGLAGTNLYLSYLFMTGMSEPMAAATVLAAVDNHIRGRRGSTLLCLALAGLLRPEAWPFLFAYCLWLCYRSSAWRRVLLISLAVAVPAVWFIIDWFGSRQFLRSTGAAASESQGGPLLSRQPGIATFRETWHLVSGPLVVLFLVGLIVAIVGWARTRRIGPTLWIAAAAVGWLVIDALLAQGRFATGAPRYLLPGAALACVVAGVLVADCVHLLARARPIAHTAALSTVLGCVALVVFCGPRTVHTVREIHNGFVAGRHVARLADALPRAIALAGGRDAVLGCGPVSTENFQVPLVAWQLDVPLSDVRIVVTPTGTVLQQSGGPRIPATLAGRYRPVGTSGAAGFTRWTVSTTCPPGG